MTTAPSHFMSPIRFAFSPEKLIAAVAYFASRGVKKLDILKTVKLLFYADKEHLLTHGRPILGDVYFCMPHGPVPSYSKNVIGDALSGYDAEPGLLKYVTPVLEPGHDHKQFKLKAEPDLGQLSRSEIAALDRTIQQYGGKDPWTLRNLSHNEQCWKLAEATKKDGVQSVPMPYELFFEGAGAEAQEILALVRDEQEDRDLACDLAR